MHPNKAASKSRDQTAYSAKHYKRHSHNTIHMPACARPTQVLAVHTLLVLACTIQALPSTRQDWAAHKRALLQLQNESLSTHPTQSTEPPPSGSDNHGAGNASTTPTKRTDPQESNQTPYKAANPTPDIVNYHTPNHRGPPTPIVENLIISSTPILENRAESVLQLLLENADQDDVKTTALQLLPEYIKLCPTPIDCEKFGAAVRRQYLTKYSNLEQKMRRMDKVGLLLRRIRHLLGQKYSHGNTPETDGNAKHHSHHERRRPGWTRPGSYLRINHGP